MNNAKQPAFATQKIFAAGHTYPGQEGLTKREYFAGQIMVGMVTSCYSSLPPENITKKALVLTDALLKELEK